MEELRAEVEKKSWMLLEVKGDEEEVEDLRYNYQEAVKKNVEYEQQITSLL